MKVRIFLFVLLVSVIASSGLWARPIALESPDGSLTLNLVIKEDGEKQGLFYNLQKKRKRILEDSRLGLQWEGEPDLAFDFTMEKVRSQQGNQTYRPEYGERSTIQDTYSQGIITYQEKSSPQRKLTLVIRMYDEGAAFRYQVEREKNSEYTLTEELTEFRFPKGTMVYEEHGTEGKYHHVKVSEVQPRCEMPLTAEIGEEALACIMEANVQNHPTAKLSPGEHSQSLRIDLDGEAHYEGGNYVSPWRVIMVGETPGDLVEQNDLLFNLNAPNGLSDTSWIKPGTVIRCIRLNTEWGKKYIDFADQFNIDYVHFDAGWYGPEREEDSDARTPKEDLDIKHLIKYAEERNIGISVYVNRIALEKQIDEIFPLYEEWGIKAVKFGFVRVGKQEPMKWLVEAVRKAAEHRLMVDIHDSYRPSGLSRTYPNLMTQEGIRGNEHMPTSEHNVTLPFTRYPAGAGDYTICYYSDRLKTTHAHQLAASIVFYSPLKFLFWYDTPDEYQGEEEITLFKHLPSVWNDTRVLHGKIGDYVCIARKNALDWFIGAMSDENPRELEIPLTFLDSDKTYTASIYSDDLENEESRTKVKSEQWLVTNETVIKASLAPNGGQAIYIRPAKKSEREELEAYR